MKNYTQLSQEERYTIAYLSGRHYKVAQIARELGRHRSTIGREIQRNKRAYDGGYRAEQAQSYYQGRRRRSRYGFHHTRTQMQPVFYLIKKKWSPEQISFILKKSGVLSISHETIYKHILYDKKHGGTLYTYLRIIPKIRRKRYNTRDSRGRLLGKRSIQERPTEVETRKIIGHWEGDTVIGRDRHHCIVTLVERKSGLVIIKKITARTSEQVTAVVIEAIRENPGMFKTITFDNGSEFHGYKKIEKETGVVCYFAAPYHSWERGSNENCNGLIRQYLPKRKCMSAVSQRECNWIAKQLNTRPRKRHNYTTPMEVFCED
jgi:transposase, IS30 family